MPIIIIFLSMSLVGNTKECNPSKAVGEIPAERVYEFDLYLSLLPVLHHSEFPEAGVRIIPSSRFNSSENFLNDTFEIDMVKTDCFLRDTLVNSTTVLTHVNYTLCKLAENNYTDLSYCSKELLSPIVSFEDLLSLSLVVLKRILRQIRGE